MNVSQAFLFLLMVIPTVHAYERVTLGAVSYYYEGDYGLEETTFTWVQQISAKYQRDAWSGQLSLPYISQDGPAYYEFIDVGTVENPDVDELVLVREKRSGMGDPTATLAYSWPKRSRNGRWTLSGRYKAPIADEDAGLSNGRQEVSGSLSRSWRIHHWMLNGRAGLQWREAKEGYDNSRRVQISLGSLYFLNNRTGVGVSYYQRMGLSSASDPIKTLSAQMRYRLTPSWQIGANYGRGLTESTSDQFIGLQISYAKGWRSSSR